MTSASDPTEVKKAKRKAEDALDVQRTDLTALLKLPEFRRYVWRHINETCGLLQSASNPNGSVQSINLGMQDVGRKLWAELEQADPLVIPKMMTEHFEAQKAQP